MIFPARLKLVDFIAPNYWVISLISLRLNSSLGKMAADDKDLMDRIVVDPKIMVGKPVIKGTRIPVYTVLEFIESGHTIDDITEAYPDLDKEDVKAAIRYARDVVEREEVKARRAVA